MPDVDARMGPPLRYVRGALLACAADLAVSMPGASKVGQ
jgi:hypothetical protein